MRKKASLRIGLAGSILAGALAVSSLVAAPAPGASGVNGRIDLVLGDHAAYQRVILAAQRAVAAHDPSAVAALVRYPIVVTIDGRRRTIRTPGAFVAHYPSIMTPEIVRAVVSSRYDSLFVNWQGVMFGDGQMWINGLCRDAACRQVDVKIATIQPGVGSPPKSDPK